METNPIKVAKKQALIEKPATFQDTLISVAKVFWKAGYQYSQKGMNEDFYATILDDFMNLPYQEFLKKYGE